MASKVRTCINSEIGKLEAVLIHTPGSELENMTPDNAERSLYSDILNLQIALKEFRQLKGVLNVVSSTFEVKNLLQEILENKDVRTGLVKDVCSLEGVPDAQSLLLSSEADLLARQLIEGVALEKNTLTRYLSNERFLLKPLHNLFFTRDAAMGMNENILIGKMASGVRKRESLIMKAIFKYHPLFEASIIDPMHTSVGGLPNESVSIEGGDFLVAKEDVFIVGAGIRTSTQGIDFIIENLQNRKNGVYQVIVQELPSSPESFIHLDMVFTILDVDTCMVYKPIILESNKHHTIKITIEGGRVTRIAEYTNILEALKTLGIELKPVSCGGDEDSWIQEREQWHSGANFLAFEPGKVIGYARNSNTVEELHKNGFEVLAAGEIIKGKVNPSDFNKCVITIEGSELARGGGGARCMTMPVRRAGVRW